MTTPNKTSITPKPPQAFQFQWLQDVEETPIEWIWHPYIPRGAITNLVGDGGFGKSTLTCALASDLSRGRALPGQKPQAPMNILMLTAEDGLSQVIKKKLRFLDADMTRVAGFEDDFQLNPQNIARMVETMKQVDATVVFLDPLVVYMGGQVDIFKGNETRAILKQLNEVAKQSNSAIVIVHHVRKMQGGSIQHKAAGSADIVNASRSTLVVDISAGGQYYMAHAKSNWAAKGHPLAYRFDGETFQWAGRYQGPVGEENEISTTPRNKARSFLQSILKEGPVPANEVIERGMDEGMSERTIIRAKQEITNSFQRDGKWWWELKKEVLAQVMKIAERQGTPIVLDLPKEPTPEQLLQALGRGPLQKSGTADPLAYAKAVLDRKKNANT